MMTLKQVLIISIVTMLFLTALPVNEDCFADTNRVAITKAIPKKWFKGARGYDKALALQKQIGADIFMYFSRPNTANEKGLCSWFEAKGLNTLAVRKHLRNYIKVKVVLPGNPKNQKLAKKMYVKKCPSVFILHPNGWKRRVMVFNWSKKRPKLLSDTELVELFQQNNSISTNTVLKGP